MEKGKMNSAKRFSGGRILMAAVLCAALLLLPVSCDKLFIPGNVPDGPSALTLSSEAGERTAEPLSYYWVKTKTDERTEKEGPDPMAAEYDPLVVQPGETIRFTFADGNDPWILNLMFYESDGNGGYREQVVLSPLESLEQLEPPEPPEGEGSGSGKVYLYSAPEEDGLFVAEAMWPRWVNTGISAEATYAFYVWSAKG